MQPTVGGRAPIVDKHGDQKSCPVTPNHLAFYTVRRDDAMMLRSAFAFDTVVRVLCPRIFSFVIVSLHCALSLATECIVISPVCRFVCWCVCVCVCVCWSACYHDNSTLRASILTKLGLEVKVHLQLLNFGRPAPPGRGSAAGRKFLFPPYYSQRAVFASLSAVLISCCFLFFFYLPYYGE